MSAAAAGAAAAELRPLGAVEPAELVRLHAAAFPDSEATRLGPRYVGALFATYRAGRADPGAFGLVAVEGGRGLGFVLGSPYGSERARYRRLLPVAAAAWLARPGLWIRPDLWRVVGWRLRSVGRPTSARRAAELPPPVHLLDRIGVEPSARGQGIADRLMAGFAEQARARGARSLLLWSRRDAAPARRLYERCGWREGWPVEPDRVAYWRAA